MNRYQDLILRAKKGETILMDGATGTECERRGVPQLKNAWNGGAALSHPEILIGVHKDYIKSGSEIIISNTFANTKHALEDAGQSENFEKYNLEGVRLAIEARKNLSENVLVAGGISYWTWTGRKPSLKELRSSVEIQAKIMESYGADFLILEMMVDIEQMTVTIEATKKTKLPLWVGLTCSIDKQENIFLGEKLDKNKVGDSLESAVRVIENIGVDVICIMHTKIEDTLICLKELKTLWKGLVGVYPNSSSYNNSNNINSTEWAFEQVIHKEKFIEYAKAWNDFGVDFVGGCCGINVEHIKELAKIIK